MIRLILICWLSLFAAAVKAATADVDQLLRQYETSANGAQRIAIANRLFEYFHQEEITDEQLRFTAATPSDTLRQQVYYWAAEYFYAKQQYSRAAECGKTALPLFHAGNSRTAEGDCLNLLAITYVRLSDYPQAAKYAKLCNELDRKSGNPDNISSSLNTLASIYLSAHQPEEAERYVLQGIEYSKKADNPQRMAVLLGMASEVYHQLGDDEKSLSYATTAYEQELQLDRKDKVAIRQAQMASALIGLGRDKEAKAALEKAIPEFRTDGNRHSLGIACNQMGQLLLRGKKNTQAATYFDEALQIFVDQRDLYNESHTRKGLYEALRDSDPSLAMHHIDRYNELKDSLYDRETGQLLSKYAALYGNEQLQEENAAERSSKRQILMMCVLIAFVLLSLLWYLMHRRNQRDNRRYAYLAGELDELREQHQQLQGHYSNAIATRQAEAMAGVSEYDRRFISDAIAVVNTLLDQGSGFPRLDTLAAQLNMSASQFSRRLKEATNETPKGFVQQICIQRARYLLEHHPELTVSEIAYRCGYTDNSNFSRTFKRMLGLTPTEYLRKGSDSINAS